MALAIFFFLEPEEIIFGQEGGAGEDMFCYAFVLIGSHWQPEDMPR